VMIHATDTARQIRKVTFDRVSGNTNAFFVTHVFIGEVIHQRMLAAVSSA